MSRKRTEPKADPLGQSPDDPIEFTANNDVARGNEERANAEPEPKALHAAEVPGVPDQAAKRRELAKLEDGDGDSEGDDDGDGDGDGDDAKK